MLAPKLETMSQPGRLASFGVLSDSSNDGFQFNDKHLRIFRWNYDPTGHLSGRMYHLMREILFARGPVPDVRKRPGQIQRATFE